jgi:Rod binding domain-containing protein
MSIQPSAGSTSPAEGAPSVNQALEPAWVRRGSASTQKAYQSALAFEQVLVEQLSQSLTKTSGLGGESAGAGEASGEESSSSGAEAGGGPFSSMLPQALTSGVMNAGGLGLAAQMTHELQAASSTTDTAASGTTGGTAS